MNPHARRGFALVSVLSMMMVLVVLLAAYFFMTSMEINTTAAQADSSSGFFAAEAGLNLRGDQILQIFRTDNIPEGASPVGAVPCTAGDIGSGDFACLSHTMNDRNVISYVIEDPQNAAGGLLRRIPPNELFAGLNAIESRYSVFSRAEHPRDARTEALLEMIFRSRLVPIFQFAAFYNKDLEINPGANMVLNGRVHANGDLYLNTGATLEIQGQVTVANRPVTGQATQLYRGRKDTTQCEAGVVRVDDLNPATGPASSPERLNCIGNSRSAIAQGTLDAWNGQIQTGLDTLTVPELRSFQLDGEYWERADLRVVLNVNVTPAVVEVRNPNQTVNTAQTSLLRNTCEAHTGSNPAYRPDPAVSPAEDSNTFYNWRERKTIRMLEIDVRGLLNCLHQHRGSFFDAGRGIDETTHGGLVFYFSVIGPQSGSNANNYGVRLRNAATLGATVGGAPAIRGLTVVSDQAVYVQGHYNRDTGSNWRPASIIADSLNLLSDAYNTRQPSETITDVRSSRTRADRVATDTEVNAAFLSGTDTTGGAEGSGGQGGVYNGGLENYPRFHETWSGRTLTYRGSFVSFDRAQRVNGAWCGTGGAGTHNRGNGNVSGMSGCNIYDPPTRNWSYDTRFNDISQLPPLSPNFVYLRQELFVREFEQ